MGRYTNLCRGGGTFTLTASDFIPFDRSDVGYPCPTYEVRDFISVSFSFSLSLTEKTLQYNMSCLLHG